MRRPLSWRCVPLVLCTMVVWTAGAGADEPLSTAEPELFVSVNLAQLRGAVLVQADKDALLRAQVAAERLAADHPVLAWLKRAGLDAVKDVDSLHLAVPRGKELNKASLILRGRFNVERLSAAARQLTDAKAVKAEPAGRRSHYDIGGSRPCAVAVDSSTLIVGADRKSLAAAIALADSTAALRPGLAELVKSIRPEHSIAVVASGPALAALLPVESFPNADKAAQTLAALDALAVTVTIASDIALDLAVYARDEAAAAKLTAAADNALRTAQGLARQSAKDDPRFEPLADVVSTLRVASKGPAIVFRLHAKLDTIERLMKNFGG